VGLLAGLGPEQVRAARTDTESGGSDKRRCGDKSGPAPVERLQRKQAASCFIPEGGDSADPLAEPEPPTTGRGLPDANEAEELRGGRSEEASSTGLPHDGRRRQAGRPGEPAVRLLAGEEADPGASAACDHQRGETAGLERVADPRRHRPAREDRAALPLSQEQARHLHPRAGRPRQYRQTHQASSRTRKRGERRSS